MLSATKKAVDEMSVREVIVELRDTPNPSTKKPHHTLTEISRIAGASKGWTAYALEHPNPSPNKRSQSCGPNLKKYLRDLRGERREHTVDDYSALGVRFPRHGLDDMHSPYAPERDHPPEPVEPKSPAFVERLAIVKERMWDFITDMDNLEQEAPALFKPVAAKLRDDMMMIHDQLGG